MTALLLVHHAARCGARYPASSLAGIAACAAAGAQVVEIDVQALADGDFALLHDALLERATTGRGPVGGQTAAYVKGQRLLAGGRPSEERVGLLSEAVDLLRGSAAPVELQLDLKAHPTALLTGERLRALARWVQPLGQRVRVSSVGDWSLRRLHALAPTLPLGFDPLLYLDLRGDEEQVPPYRCGAYGYRDDHPLAAVRWGAPAAYLEERAEALWQQAPIAGVWYIRGCVLARALDDGFDWIGFLHRRGVQVCAWTLEPSRPDDVALGRRLATAGVDRITSDDPPGLARAMGVEVAY